MSRIVYLSFPTGGVSGGQKMILRHVETLRELGFDAVCRVNDASLLPAWMAHDAVWEAGTPLRPDDVFVPPNDAPNALAGLAQAGLRTVVFCQNPFSFASLGLQALPEFDGRRQPDFIAVGPTMAAWVRRLYPDASLEIVPCFADERRFLPAPAKREAIVYVPRKRPLEARAIRNLFPRLYPQFADIPWIELDGASEAEVAQAMATSTLFLSLSRLEAVGMTPLEAMASGCLCAGFTGVGGRDFATPDNGFWVGEDDCEAAVDALAGAAALSRAGDPELARRLAAAKATAAQWSYAAFRPALEAAWMRLAPETRTL